ncbi:MAG: lamin tail domain-containing protein, partial [Candidatus Neomarinimicrobiota bacterium]|nr:lamin tail domain-containing protein [Candidatus Neomarinimicrobiota bacterium]
MRKVLFIPLLITVIVAQTVDYDTDIQPLWNANCTSCHGANGSGGLNLSTGQSYDNLVDVASSGNGYDGALRVASGDADNSVLYDKITNGGTYGGQMPPSALMSSANRTLVQTWINELSSANYITIAAARNQDEGTSVTVRGIVTTPNFQSSNTEYGLQDGTGGIVIFHFSAPYVELAVGDSVEVTGELDIFSGKTEVIPSSADDITIISQNNDLPDFQVITVADYVANAEDYESELIKINAVSITDGSWPTAVSSNLTISDDGGNSTVTMRIDSDMDIIGNDEPEAPFDVRGIAGQYDSTDPYDSGYQILPRYYTDFIPGEDVVDPPDLVINEFLAATDLCCDDGNGEVEDFIEIYNPGNEAVDIGGLWITDDLEEPDNWEQIPTTDASITTVAAGGHIVIWADKDQDTQGILHTDDIKLSADGEQIGLIFISGTDTVFVDSLSFGEQTDDIS